MDCAAAILIDQAPLQLTLRWPEDGLRFLGDSALRVRPGAPIQRHWTAPGHGAQDEARTGALWGMTIQTTPTTLLGC